MARFDRIVVGVDGSDCSIEALRWAVTCANSVLDHTIAAVGEADAALERRIAIRRPAADGAAP